MIRTMLTLRIAPENVDAVIAHYRAHRILEAAIDHAGALESELLVTPGDPGALVVLSRWPDRTAYGAWLDHPARAASTAGILAVLGTERVGGGVVFEVVDRVLPPADGTADVEGR